MTLRTTGGYSPTSSITARTKPWYSALSVIVLTFLMSRALSNSAKIAQQQHVLLSDVVVSPRAGGAMEQEQESSSLLLLLSSSSSSSWLPTSLKSNLKNVTTHNNRTLVILIGNVRGGEKAWDSLYRNLLDVNMADLALFIGADTDTTTTSAVVEYQNASLFGRARYIWTFSEYNDWADAIDDLLLENNGNSSSSSWRDQLIPLLYNESKLLGGIKGGQHGGSYQGSGAIIFVIRWLLSKKLQELDMLQHYDRFVITRADHCYRCAHDLSQLNDNHLWVPAGEDYGGITDRHLVVSSRHILSALHILPPVVQHPENYTKLLARRRSNPERLLWRRWVEQGLAKSVRRFNRMFFTCGDDPAGRDTSRWTQLGSELVSPEQVYLKYPNEYDAAYRTCGLEKDRQYGDIVIPLVLEPVEAYYNSNEERSRLQSLITTTTSNVSSEKEMLDTTLRSDCYIRFQNPHMRLCNFVPYGNNFGDELGPAVTLRILQEYFECANVSAVPVVNLAAVGFPVQRSSNEPCLFAVGSIFHFVRSGDHVWGTGINPFRRRKEMHATDIVVHSVRGPLSLEWLLEKRTSFITASLVGFGDPGFLIPFLYPEFLSNHQPKPVTTNRRSNGNKSICFVPHFHDLESEQVTAMSSSTAGADDAAVKIISPHSSWRNVVQRLHDECNLVASSSLHGLIVADCLGIPSRWVQLDGTQTQTTEGHFKYQDYFQSFNAYINSTRSSLTDATLPESRLYSRTISPPIRDPSQILHDRAIYGASLSTMERIRFAQMTIASFPVRLFEIVEQTSF